MGEFNHIFVSILFGLSGTFIILFSNIFSYKNKIKNKEKFSLVSQMIGFLFLFNSFLYQLHPKITEFLGVGVSPPITEFFYFPYYLFILGGIIISLFLVKEEDFGGKLEVIINPKNWLQYGFFFSPLVFAGFAMVLNGEFLLIVTIIAWFKFMSMLWWR